MNKNNDPMGRAISDYYRTGTAGRLRVFSPMFEEDEIPLVCGERGIRARPVGALSKRSD
jgi:hypothetical protein